jgi:antitoxin (DNA-binding transcriptional repressor) of toxin-antitoxin stability system
MKTVEISEASLDEYGRKGDETWILTRRGKPVAAVVPMRRGMDAETFSLSHNPAFIDIINRSWARYRKTGGKSLDEVRKKYGVDKPARKSRRKSR